MINAYRILVGNLEEKRASVEENIALEWALGE
jgi:hypothetical protein